MAMKAWPRYDLQTRTVAGGRIDVYRRDDRLGTGPCMSLYAGTVEIMRFDLFDPAHEHWAVGKKTRMYYPEGLDRFTLAGFHLRHHSRFVAALLNKRLKVSDADAE